MNNPAHIVDRLKTWVAANGRHNDQCDVFIEELCFIDKTRRADLVHANGKLTAFEVKSSADTLARWGGQQVDYLSCFDEVWLACHTKHAAKAITTTLSDIGIIVVDDFSGMAVVRMPRSRRKIDPYQLTGFLWRSELDRLALENHVPISRKDLLKEARRKVSGALDVDTIKSAVLSALKARYL